MTTSVREGEIAGLPAKAARDAIRRAGLRFNLRDLANAMHSKQEWNSICYDSDDMALALAAAARFLKDLVADGYASPSDDAELFERTAKGDALARARATKRIARAKALAMLEAFLGRVVEVNAREELTERVVRVTLYGSLLSNTPDVGDIDLLVEVDHKGAPDGTWDPKWYEKRVRARIAAHGNPQPSEIHSPGYGIAQDPWYFGWREVWKLLRGGNSYLAFRGFNSFDAIAGDKRVIYESGEVLRENIPRPRGGRILRRDRRNAFRRQAPN